MYDVDSTTAPSALSKPILKTFDFSKFDSVSAKGGQRNAHLSLCGNMSRLSDASWGVELFRAGTGDTGTRREMSNWESTSKSDSQSFVLTGRSSSPRSMLLCRNSTSVSVVCSLRRIRLDDYEGTHIYWLFKYNVAMHSRVLGLVSTITAASMHDVKMYGVTAVSKRLNYAQNRQTLRRRKR